MKKKLLLIPLALLLAISLVAIGCPATETTTPPTTTPPTTTPPTTTAPPEGPITLVEANWTPAQLPPPIDWEPFDFAINRWMDTIELETDGRVVFERYPTGTLVGMADMYESTKAGICDIGLVNVPALPDQFPLTNSLRLPGLFQNTIQASVIRQTLLEEGYIANEWKDVKVLWMGGTAPWSLSCREKQVRTMEDLKGLKIANIGEPELSFIGALGAVPVAMPNTEFYMALERGAVDGCWMDTNGQVAFGFYNVSPYLTEIPANGYGSVTWCMNQEKYNSLPPDIKAIFDRNIGMLGSLLHGERFERNTAVAISFLNDREDYPPVYILPPEEEARWLEAGEPLIEATIADLEAQGLPAEVMFERVHELVEIYETWGF